MLKLKNSFKIINFSLFCLFILFSNHYIMAIENHNDNTESEIYKINDQINKLSIERNQIITKILSYENSNSEMISILESRYQNLTQIIINLEQQIIILIKIRNCNQQTNHQNHDQNPYRGNNYSHTI
ncbi:hypothetical protein [Candidatus Phytoplasma prunorum]|uniref:hypothetical protein n=1 Tax=Candidatus Phytoplasma prunorum TaxID=47565 RepID=UPI002FEE86A1